MTRVNRLAIVLALGMAAGLAQTARAVKYPAWTGKGADNCFTNTANWNDSAIFTDLDNVPRPLAGEAEFDIDLPDYELYNPALVFAVRKSWGKIVLNGQGHTFSMPAPKEGFPHVNDPRVITFASGVEAYTSPRFASLELKWNDDSDCLTSVFSWTDANIVFERSAELQGTRLVFSGGTYDFAPPDSTYHTFIINDGYAEARTDVRFLNATTHLPNFDFRASATNNVCVVSGGVWTVAGDLKYGYQSDYFYPGTNYFHFTGGVRGTMVGKDKWVYFSRPQSAAYRHQVWLVEGEGTSFDMRNQSVFAFRGDSNLIVSNGATFVMARNTQLGCGTDALDTPTITVEGEGTSLLGAPSYNSTTPQESLMTLGYTANTRGTLTVNGGLVSGAPEHPNGLYLSIGDAEGATGVCTVNGGTVNLGGGTIKGQSILVGNKGRGTLTQTGGLITTLKPVQVCSTDAATCSGTVNLDGGRFEAVQLLGRFGTGAGGKASPSLTADGGTLKATSADYKTASKAFVSGFDTALIGAGGLTVDTDGNDVYVAQAFGNKSGASGRLVRAGAGTLTLTGPQTVSEIVVEEGTLAVAAGTEDWTSSLAFRPGTTLTLAGTPSLLKLGGLVATNLTLVLDSQDSIEIDGSLELSGLTLAYVTPPTLGDVSTLFTCRGRISDATAKTLRQAVSVLTLADGTHAVTEVAYDEQAGTTRIDVRVRNDLDPIGPEGTTTWQGGAASDWQEDGSWTAGVPDATQKAAFTSSSAAKDVTVPAGTAVGALAFADTGYRLSGGDLEIAAEKGAAEIAVTAGAHEIASPVRLDTEVSVPVTEGASLEISGDVENASLKTSGNGLLTLSGGLTTLGLTLGGGTVTIGCPTPDAVAGDIYLACAANEAATVLKADSDVLATAVNAKSGVLVKRGTGTLTVDVASGKTTRLANNTNGPDPGGSNGLPKSTAVQSFAEDGSSPTAGVAGFTIAEGEVRFDGSAVSAVPTFSAGGCVMVGMNVDACGAQPTLTLDHALFNARDNQPSATHFYHGWRAGVAGNAVVSPVIRILNGATLYCDTYKGGPDAGASGRPLVAITNGTLKSSYATSLSLCTPNSGAQMVFRCKDATIFAGNDTVKPIQIAGVIDFEGANTTLTSLNNSLGGVYLNGYSKGRVYLHDGGLFHSNGFFLQGALAHDITFAFNDTEWRGANSGSYSITNGPNAANGHLIVEMVGRGAIFNPGAGNTVTTETAFSGEGGLQVRSGTFRFAAGTCGYAGTTHVAAGATVDLSVAGKIAAARFGGDGTVSGGSFGSLTIDPGTTDGSVPEAPTFASCASEGRIRVDLGLPEDHEWPRPYPTGLVVARFTGTVPTAAQFRLVNAGRGFGGDFTVADDGTVTMDVVPKGLMIIFR